METSTTTAAQAMELARAFPVRDAVLTFAPEATLERRGREWNGPCPRCGGSDRFYLTADNHAACRQCHPARMDAVGVVAWILDVPMHVAVARMSEVTGKAAPLAPPPPVARSGRTQTNPAAERVPPMVWSWDMACRVEAAMERLQSDPRATVQREYLANRGLEPATWDAWRLGAATVRVPGTSEAVPAVCLPITDYEGGQTVGIKFRLIGAESVRYTMQHGSMARGHVFGAWHLYPYMARRSTRALFIVEGELNAVSIAQAAEGMDFSGTDGLDGVTAVSMGSETQTQIPAWLSNLALEYRRVVLWYDKATTTPTASPLRNVLTMYSATNAEGVKGDANELLQRGRLAGVIANLIRHTA